MADKEIEPREGGRPWGCIYSPEDHQRTATYVREKAPELFAWLKEHRGFGEDNVGFTLTQKFWHTVKETLPKATLVDHAEVMFILRLQATPLSEEDRERLDDARRGRELFERNRPDK